MTELAWILYSSGYLVFAIVFLLVAKKLFDLLTPYSVNVQLTEKDNPALGILLVGFLLGVTAIICSVFAGEGTDTPSLAAFWEEIVPVAIYGALGIVLLFVAGIINDKAVLHKFSCREEVIQRRNVAVAAVVAGTFIGSGLIIAGGIYSSVSLLSALIPFVVGQIALIIFAMLYQVITKYDYHEQLGEKKNIAAGIAFGGNIVAYSLVLMKGVTVRMDLPDAWTWQDRLLNFAYYAVVGCVLLVITRTINDRLFLPKAKIAKEIAVDKNPCAGLMEAGLAIAVGVVLVCCL